MRIELAVKVLASAEKSLCAELIEEGLTVLNALPNKDPVICRTVRDRLDDWEGNRVPGGKATLS